MYYMYYNINCNMYMLYLRGSIDFILEDTGVIDSPQIPHYLHQSEILRLKRKLFIEVHNFRVSNKTAQSAKQNRKDISKFASSKLVMCGHLLNKIPNPLLSDYIIYLFSLPNLRSGFTLRL